MLERRYPGFLLRACFVVAVAGTSGHATAEGEESEASVTGTITGIVVFRGEPPVPKRIQIDHDASHCGTAAPIVDESMRVAPSGGLANVVVVLRGVDSAPGHSPKTSSSTLDQRNCTFVPHVQSVTRGGLLRITSSDHVLHNVHAFHGDRTAFNLAMPVANKSVERRLDEPGILRIQCDSGHRWMSAFIAVVPHRFHATTDPEGRFQIPSVPPGRYELRAWHERLGAVRQRITISQGQVSSPVLIFSEESEAESSGGSSKDLFATQTVLEQLQASRRTQSRQQASQAGRALYMKYCSTCHGRAGNGQGPSSKFVSPPPRDFTRGMYKFRTTPAGARPTRLDLERTIRMGLRGTHMPAWGKVLSATQIRILAEYIMTLSDRFWDGSDEPVSLKIPKEPPYDAASVARGKQLYKKMQCATCHGLSGRGDGVAAASLRDDAGRRIRPANFSQGAIKGGCCGGAVYRAISTGLNGTPMPSFEAVMTPSERWDLAHYVVSLFKRRPGVDYLLTDPAGRISTP